MTLALSPQAWSQTVTTFTTAGNSTWTCPPDVFSVQVQAYGGGGGGGGCAYTNGVVGYACAGGGAGGSYVKYSLSVTPGTVYNLTVGAGGAGGTNGVSPTWSGLSGGSSYFGNTSAGSTNGASICAVGGPGGTGDIGYPVGTTSSRTGGIPGGIATTNGSFPNTGLSVIFPGTSGGTSIGGADTGTAKSGAGGAGAGPSGSSGGGAGGAADTASGSSQVGLPGTAPGGGGSGAANVSLSKGGGAGGVGDVVLTYTAATPAAGTSTVVANPASIPADGATTSTITVTLEDTNGDLISGKTITLASNRGSTDTISPTSATTSAAGTATFTVTSTTSGPAIFTATDTSDSVIISETATVAFIASSVEISYFTVTPSVSSAIAGRVFTATVQAFSPSGPITDNSADGLIVTMTSSGLAQFDANGDGVYGDNFKALTNGTLTINVRDLKAEALTLTATLSTSSGTSSSVSVTPGALAQLQLLLPGETATPGVAPGFSGSPVAETAGTGFMVTVKGVDTNWNVTAATDTIALTAVNDSAAILPANAALVNGSVTLTATNAIAGGGRSLTATDISASIITPSTSPGYVVVPGAVAKMLLLAPGETATYGVPPGKSGTAAAQYATIGYSVTVAALDAYYNLATNAADTVAIDSSFIGDTLPGSAALAGGLKTFSLTNNSVGAVILTATNETQGLAVAAGTSTVPVNINSTTTTLATSPNPANAGQLFTLTATVAGAGYRTGTVTFKNGQSTLGTATLSGGVASYALSGGSGTYALSAVYNGDGNNLGSTSAPLSQVIQAGVTAVPAQMQEGFDYATYTSVNTPSTVGPWQITSDYSQNTSSSGHPLVVSNDLSGATAPDILPIPNVTNPPAHFQMSAGATDREFLRSIGNSITNGSAYFSFLLEVTVNPTSTGEYMATMLAANTNKYPDGTDPFSLLARKGLDTSHFNLGVQRLGGNTNWAANSLAINTTYLVVLKYAFGPTASNSVYINPIPGDGEPTPAVSVTAGTYSEPDNIGTVLFYEANTSGDVYVTTGTYNYDVMRVDSSWANVTPPAVAPVPGAAALAFISAPQTVTVYSNTALITLSLLDSSNNTFSATANTTVSLSSSSPGGTFLSATDGSTVINSVTISNGTSMASFFYKDSVAGEPTLTAASGLLTPATQTALVNPPAGLLDHFVVTPSTSSATAGAIFTVTVQAYDSNDVAIVGGSLNGILVTMTSSGVAQFDANGDGVYGDNLKALTNGTLTINVRDLKAESLTLTATLGAISGTSRNISITPGALAQLQVLLPGETATPDVAPGYSGSPATETAGTGFTVTINGVDTNWNVTTASDTVKLTASNDAGVILPANAALVNGTVTLAVTNIIAGSGRTLTVTDIANGTILSSTSPGYVVNANNATQLIALAPGETPTFGVAPGKTGTPSHEMQTAGFTLTVYALDAYYNLATSDADSVAITSTDDSAILPASGTLAGGTKQFTMVNNTQGAVTDTASDVSNGGVLSGSTTLVVDPIPRYRSVESGNWSDTNTWQYSSDGGNTWSPAIITPNSSLAATVEITNGITVTVDSNLSINRTTVDTGGTLTVPSISTLSVTTSPVISLDVYGTVINSGTITPASGAVIDFEASSSYIHARDGGAIPACTWNLTSTCAVTGVVSAIPTDTTFEQAFGNFVWNCPGQTAEISFAGDLKNVKGNLIVLSTGSSQLDLAKDGFTAAQINVAGNVYIEGGTLYIYSSAATGGVITFAVGGNVAVTGGTLAGGTNVASSSVLEFTNSGTKTFTSGGTLGGRILWQVLAGVTLDLGNNVVSGNGTFTLNPGAGLVTASPSGFAGNFVMAATNLSLSTLANYTYDGSTSQSGDSLLPATVAGLTVNNASGLILYQAESVSNLTLVGSSLSGNATLGSSGAFTVIGSGSEIAGDVTLNTSSLIMVPSNSLPTLSVNGGILSLDGGAIVLTNLGPSLTQGNYLLVSATSGGAVTGTTPIAAMASTGSLLPALTAVPEIVGGELYLDVIAFYAGYDAGPGFFGGENLILTNLSGASYYAWSSPNPSVPLSSWNLEGPLGELPLGNSGFSVYGINVNPSSSPTYYILGTTNGGPYLQSPLPVLVLTTSDFTDFNVNQVLIPTSAGGSLKVAPTVSQSVQITKGGPFSFEFNGVNGLGYSVWASTNLTSGYKVVSTGVFNGSLVKFSDPNAPSYPRQFYRVSTP